MSMVSQALKSLLTGECVYTVSKLFWLVTTLHYRQIINNGKAIIMIKGQSKGVVNIGFNGGLEDGGFLMLQFLIRFI